MAKKTEKEDTEEAGTMTTEQEEEPQAEEEALDEEEVQKREAAKFAELERKAVLKAKATADNAFRPSTSILNASTTAPLLAAVDGPNLKSYEEKESVYVGRTVPVAAGGRLTVPLQVTAPGSVVEYAVELKSHDVGFGITAEREEGVTIVKEVTRVDHRDMPLTQKFLVGTVPCLIQFAFENDYSWMREKVVSYKITVTPPSVDSLSAGRRRRATSCLKAVEEDAHATQERLAAAQQQKRTLAEQVEQLTKELVEKKKALAVADKEETFLTERSQLRTAQIAALNDRLEKGWPDEGEDDGSTTKKKGKK